MISTQVTHKERRHQIVPHVYTDGCQSHRIGMYFLVEIATFIIVHILALFYGCLVLLRILWTVVRHPLSLCKVKRSKVPECLINHKYGQHHFIKTPSKMVFHYVAKGDKNKPLMLCLHGYPEFWYSWRYQLQGLSDEYRVIAMDLRGYGETDHPEGRSMYTMDKLTQDVKEFVSCLGYSSFILVCHDMGGYIGWTLAHQYPELVEKLILLSCPHPMCADKYTITHPSQLMFKSWFVFFFQLPYIPELWIRLNDFAYLDDVFRGQELGVRRSGAITDEDIEAYKYAFGRKGALTPPLNYFRNLLNRPQGSHVIYNRRFRKPVLIIWGTGDGALESGMLEGTERFAPNLTIRYVDGASHWVQQEEPEIVNDCIHDFLTANSYELAYHPE